MNLVIIGAGPAGYEASIRASQFGNNVTLIEKDFLGGTCLNVGCIPSKAFLSYSDFIFKSQKMRNGLSGEVNFDIEQIYEEKTKLVSKLRKGIESILKSYKVNLIKGSASFNKEGLITVNDETIEYDKVILATGSKPIVPKSLKLEGFTITSNEVINNPDIGNTIVIVGAGVIGCELAFVLKSMGKDVTIVEKEESILLGQDVDAIRAVEFSLKKHGIKVIKGSGVRSIENKKITLDNDENITCDKCVISIGRGANTQGLNLENVDVKLGDKSQIIVDSEFKTSNENIYAVGDVNGGIQLAHFASNCALNVVHKLNNKEFNTDLSLIPKVTYTFPEIASVYSKHYSENDKSNKVMFGAIGKAIAIDLNQGFCKIFSNNEGLLTGGVIVGHETDNLINIFSLAMSMNLKVKDLTKIIYPHPSLSEIIFETAEDTQNIAIHKMKR